MVNSYNYAAEFSLSVPKSEFEEALKRKILQMDDVSTVKFNKFAASLPRMTEEEHDAGITDPWKTAASTSKEPCKASLHLKLTFLRMRSPLGLQS